ncbi:DUF1207 domain-containing protein [Tellurirhabdus rosea]|uniref:DUF1207 domain-containing protein n=1 Tax=Tellurirhabdus rosea TaxID=2674997 RepID=UPI00225C215F|nr:DUF1207 domain-containing protein [Tellurirhabdus rosea]
MKQVLLLFVSLLSVTVAAQDTDAARAEADSILSLVQGMMNEPDAPRREFLPQGHLFEPIVLDPLEAQTYVSLLPSYTINGDRYEGSMVPFAFGLRKPFWRWNREGWSSEFAIDVASFTQFEIYSDPTTRRQRRQLVNTDYRVGFWYNLKVREHAWRFRVYHLSSHLGDDYTIRNGISYYLPNAVNYEQVDLTYSHQRNGFRKYVGLGVVLRKPTERKRLAGQAGVYFRNLRNAASKARFVAGADVKVWEQTAFKPGLHAGFGLELGTPSRHVTFLIEGYNGFRPYSLYEGQHVSWAGVGFYFSPI